jgi:hypothetical protein
MMAFCVATGLAATSVMSLRSSSVTPYEQSHGSGSIGSSGVLSLLTQNDNQVCQDIVQNRP